MSLGACKGRRPDCGSVIATALAEFMVLAYPAAMRPGSTSHLSHQPPAKWSGGGLLLDEAAVMGAPEGGPAAAKLDLPALFGNTRPVEVEIGTGKGTFLLARAAARPEMNFLGIEWARAYALYTADRVRRARLENVRVLRADAAHVFHQCLANESVWRVHIYFPDPWPKQRHHRRRLIQTAFLRDVRRILRIGGQVLAVTDHQDYFRQIQRVLGRAPGFAATSMPRMADRDGEIVGTNFERKYIAQGRPFYSLGRLRYR
jgi:tRNA (guanine-N7-)-methyltransferase